MTPNTDIRKVALYILGATAGLILLLVGGNLLLNYGWLKVTLSNDAKGPVNISIERDVDSPESKSFTLEPGESKTLFLKKGGVRADAASGDHRGIHVTTVKPRSTVALELTVGKKQAIQKIGSDMDICPVFVSGVSYSYDCRNTGQVYRHLKLSASDLTTKVPLFNEGEFNQLNAVGDGLVGFLDGESAAPSQMVYLDLATETVIPITLPEGVLTSDGNEPALIPSDDPASESFILRYDNFNTMYLVKGITAPEVTSIPIVNGVRLASEHQTVNVQLKKDGIVMYTGPVDDEHAGEGTKKGLHEVDAPEKELRPMIYHYDLSGRVTKKIEAPDDFATLRLIQISPTFYTKIARGGLTFYYYDGKGLKKIYTSNEAAAPVVYNEEVYFVSGKSAYRFTPKENGSFSLVGVFSSSNITVSELFGTKEGLIMTGFPKRAADSNPRDMYRLLDEEQQLAPLEDRLKFDMVDSFLAAYDYDDDTFLGTLRVNSNADYDAVRERLRERINELGVDLGGRSVEPIFPN